MNEEKLDALFREYLENGYESQSRCAIWDAETQVANELHNIEKEPSLTGKKSIFLRMCKAVAKNLPMLDWSMISVFNRLDAETICNGVLYYVNNPQPNELTVAYLRELVNKIAKRAFLQGIITPLNEVVAQTLLMLRYLKQPQFRCPYLVQALRCLPDYLECRPESNGHDYVGILLFQNVFETIVDSLCSRFEDKLRQLAVQRYREKHNIRYLDTTHHYLVTHFLMIVGSENLCRKVTEHSDAQSESKGLTIAQYLDNARNTVALLEPQLAFCEKELAFFCSCLAPGSRIVQERFGEGTVLQNDGKTITVQFSDGKKRNLKLIEELVRDRISVDSNQEEFEMRLFFSKNALKNVAVHGPMLSDAKARVEALSSRAVAKEELSEMKLFQPNS